MTCFNTSSFLRDAARRVPLFRRGRSEAGEPDEAHLGGRSERSFRIEVNTPSYLAEGRTTTVRNLFAWSVIVCACSLLRVQPHRKEHED
jgi:hypothetical protein